MSTADAERKYQKRLAKQVGSEKDRWIHEHGSDYLKKGWRAGYDMHRAYLEERAALEYPGYTVDLDGTLNWRPRATPSPEALDESLRVGGRVVWLPDHDREVVVITEYLGKYTLSRDTF